MNPGELALMIPIVAIVAGAVVKLSRMKAEARQHPGLGDETLSRLEALEAEVDGLRRDLGETQERLDFTERLLAQATEARAVRPPSRTD